jgi:bacterioferritin
VLRYEVVRLDRTIPDFYLNRSRTTVGVNIAPSSTVIFKLNYLFNRTFGPVLRVPAGVRAVRHQPASVPRVWKKRLWASAQVRQVGSGKGDTMPEQDFDKAQVIALVNEILESELAGVVRYTHYSFMVFGYSRIPIVEWLRQQAATGLRHAHEAGEMVTHLGEHPSLKIGKLLETHKHEINDILLESLEAERDGLSLYKKLLDLVKDKSVLLEEYARRMIAEEEMHVGEVNKMLRKPGAIQAFRAE